MRMTGLALACVFVAPAALGDATITINGKTISVPGKNVTVINNTVIVDGQVLSGNLLQGSGEIASDQRSIEPFDSLRLNINAAVTIRRGEEPRCLLSADDNILPFISTTSSGGVLDISATQGYATRQPVTITLETPLLRTAELNGSGSIVVTDAFRDSAAFVIRGAGDIIAKGQVEEMTARIDGAGNLRAAELTAKKATVTINGAGDVFLTATNSLRAAINGSGDIVYRGKPNRLHTSVRGSGNVRQE